MKNLGSILLIAGILLVVNLISRSFFIRWDVTQDKQYTLSKATGNILKNIEEPVTITAYFTKNLPQQFMKGRQDLQDMLIEYSTQSGDMVNYEFIDPNEDEAKEQEAIQNGISPLLLNVREKDESVQKKAFMGAILKTGETQDVIPLIQPGAPIEYMLTTAIKKVSTIEKPTIGYITGHGEPSLDEGLAIANQAMGILYNIEDIDLSFHDEVGPHIKTILWVNPQDSIPPVQFDKLNRYLDTGGHLCLAFNTVDGDFQSVQGVEKRTGIAPWLATKGLNVNTNFVVDAKSGNITVQQRQGMFSFNTAVNFPYFPAVSNFVDHPITKGIEQVIFQFVSSIDYNGDDTYTFEPIVQSSSASNVENVPVFFNVEKKWSNADFPLSSQTIAGVLEKISGTGMGSKIVVFSDGDFPAGAQSRGQNPDNVSLLVNGVDWLSDDTGLIDLRTKGVTSRPIDEIDDAKKAQIKWFNFLLPILLVLGYGLFRSQRNRSKRAKRMQERYV